MKYYQTFVVTGAYDFPIDMLRYDACFPYREKDSQAIANTLRPGGKKMSITIGRYISDKKAMPTKARWKSFGWRVDKVKVS